jgi:hypothetical protein
MYRIVPRPRILPFDRTNELIASTLGMAGLAPIVVAAVLSGFALYPWVKPARLAAGAFPGGG